ncbi:uncharacterized protein LOC113395375 [Vanessa tameamea]|uniref:Uncharacterized protein LOC113395375 n=1 Tax=Vanessa tameamea TaxID=334116 RepID=A0A8B8HVQ4_VANTA
MPLSAGNGMASVITNTQFANAINENAAIAAANQEVANAITNANLANGAANANLAALASANLAGINGNMATFNLGNAFTITSGSPGNPGFGIQVSGDALEVGGTVAVNGQIPIYGTVAVNGNLPTEGSAAVNYNCGRQTID